MGDEDVDVHEDASPYEIYIFDFIYFHFTALFSLVAMPGCAFLAPLCMAISRLATRDSMAFFHWLFHWFSYAKVGRGRKFVPCEDTQYRFTNFIVLGSLLNTAM